MSTELIITSVLLGAGLAMDAFSVSIANGLADRHMSINRMLAIAGTFAGFQFMMPMIGWVVVKRAAEKFEWFSPLIPWIALVLLLIIGGGLLKDGIEELRTGQSGMIESEASVGFGTGASECSEKTVTGESETSVGSGAGASESSNQTVTGASETAVRTAKLSFAALMMQGVATSIDALSVGFTTAAYSRAQALLSSLIIGVVTMAICLAGLRIGRRLGELLSGRASILGGLILIGIGLEIWVKGVFF